MLKSSEILPIQTVKCFDTKEMQDVNYSQSDISKMRVICILSKLVCVLPNESKMRVLPLFSLKLHVLETRICYTVMYLD